MNNIKGPKLQKDWELKENRGLPVSRLTSRIKWKRITEEFSRIIKKTCKNKSSVLDIGGGDGSFYFFIKECCSSYSVIDPSEKMIQKFQKSDNKYAYLGCGEHIPCANEAFDIVLLNSSLDHCFDPLKVLSEARRVLKPDGRIYILLTNEGAWYKKIFRDYNNNMKKKTDEHNFYFRSEEIKEMLMKQNFKHISIKCFDFFRLPVFMENILFYIIPGAALKVVIDISDKFMRIFFPCGGGSFICVAGK